MNFRSFAVTSLHAFRPFELLMQCPMRTLSTTLSHCVTLFLFTKSDIKTTVVPVGIFAIGTSPIRGSYTPLLQSTFWIWLVVLQFNIFNQYYGVDEDRKNKPWRPLPSNRISLSTVSTMRYIITLLVASVSWWYSPQVLAASISFSTLIVIYHAMHGDSNWIMKNVLNGAGYGCLAWGGALVASFNRSSLDSERIFGLSLLVTVIITTIQAQDFQDTVGDRLMGRVTMPMIWPSASRYTLLLILLTWSSVLSYLWIPNPMVKSLYIATALFVGGRYCVKRSCRDDEWSYFFYNMWLAITISLPAFGISA